MSDPKVYQQPVRRPPTQARAEESREKILLAARKAFATHGFEAANIRDIAAEVGVTHTLIRYHFGSKEELWKDVVRDMYARLDRTLSLEALGHIDLTTVDGMKTYLRHYIRYCAQNPEQARIMISETVHGGERLEWMIGFIKDSHKALIPVFRRLMKVGVLPEVWIVSLFYVVSTISQMPFVLANTIKGLYGVDMTSEAAITAHTDAVIAILLREEPESRATWPPLPEWTKRTSQSKAPKS